MYLAVQLLSTFPHSGGQSTERNGINSNMRDKNPSESMSTFHCEPAHFGPTVSQASSGCGVEVENFQQKGSTIIRTAYKDFKHCPVDMEKETER
jgi:hypothetical protein